MLRRSRKTPKEGNTPKTFVNSKTMKTPARLLRWEIEKLTVLSCFVTCIRVHGMHLDIPSIHWETSQLRGLYSAGPCRLAGENTRSIGPGGNACCREEQTLGGKLDVGTKAQHKKEKWRCIAKTREPSGLATQVESFCSKQLQETLRINFQNS